MSNPVRAVALANPGEPVIVQVNRVLDGGWRGNELDRYDCALDPETGNGFYITLRSVGLRQFVVYHPITLADDGRNPRIVAGVHAVAKNYMRMLNASRLKEMTT